MDRSTLELREHFGTCEHSYGHWIDLSLPHGRYPLWQLLRQYPDVALPQNRDIAPLRLVSWVSYEVPTHVQQVLHQLMRLFGEVAPVSSDEVIAIGIQQLGVTASGEISWDMVRDALIREVTFAGTTCPTEEVCCLMAAFLCSVPLSVKKATVCFLLPHRRAPCWGGAGCGIYSQCDQAILNHFCCWLLPCSHIGPPSHLKGSLDLPMTSNGFKWDCAQATQSFSISGVELATSKVY